MIISWIVILTSIVVYSPSEEAHAKQELKFNFLSVLSLSSHSSPQAVTGWWLPDNLAKIYSDSSLVAHSRTHVAPSFFSSASIWFDLPRALSCECVSLQHRRREHTHTGTHTHNITKENWMNGGSYQIIICIVWKLHTATNSTDHKQQSDWQVH